MATDAGNLTIINLRGGGAVKLQFPEEITSEDRANWNGADVANALKPLLFANVEPQKISISDLCIDNTRTNESVEPQIAKLRSWMRAGERDSSPPPLQIITVGFQQRVVLTELRARRQFFTPVGVCVRVYLTMTFEELQSAGVQMEVTPQRRSGNSLSGRT
jgi:hypothetical protein